MNKRVGGLLGTVVGLSLLLAACGTGPVEESTPPESVTTSTTVTTRTTTTAAPLPSVGYCTADPSMHVRVAPGPYEEVIGGLAWGEQVNIVGKEGDWYRITFKDGFAYVSAQYIADVSPAETTTADETETTTAAETDETTAE
ncbi:MAG: SH3 domain-containing protein [Clostridia bacterium]|nr:SH3 domain-containing protein [Clostridia bacterium]